MSVFTLNRALLPVRRTITPYHAVRGAAPGPRGTRGGGDTNAGQGRARQDEGRADVSEVRCPCAGFSSVGPAQSAVKQTPRILGEGGGCRAWFSFRSPVGGGGDDGGAPVL